jgi:hypothetical protein
MREGASFLLGQYSVPGAKRKDLTRSRRLAIGDELKLRRNMLDYLGIGPHSSVESAVTWTSVPEHTNSVGYVPSPAL